MTTTIDTQVKDRQVKIVFWLVNITVGLVTVIAFAISYRALSEIAAANGKNWFESLVWPLIIDGPIFAFSLAALLAMYLGKSPTMPRALVGLATLATVFFNYFHAPATQLGPVVAVTAPIMYFLSFETLLWLIRAMVERQNTIASINDLTAKCDTLAAKRDTLTATIDRLTGQHDMLKAELVEMRKEKRQNYTVVSDDTRTEAAAILAERPAITGADLGRELGKSPSLGRKLRRELLPVVSANGNGNGKVSMP